MIHTVEVPTGIVLRVTLLRAALPLRGSTASLGHSRGFLVGGFIDLLSHFQALTELKKVIDRFLDRFKAVHDHFLLPAVGNAEVQMFHDLIILEFVCRSSLVEQGKILVQFLEPGIVLLDGKVSRLATDATNVSLLMGKGKLGQDVISDSLKAPFEGDWRLMPFLARFIVKAREGLAREQPACWKTFSFTKSPLRD